MKCSTLHRPFMAEKSFHRGTSPGCRVKDQQSRGKENCKIEFKKNVGRKTRAALRTKNFGYSERSPPFHLGGEDGRGFWGWTKIFFYYDPVDIFFSSSLVIKLFHFYFRTDLFSSLEGSYLFQQIVGYKLFIFTDRLSCLKLLNAPLED